MTLVTPEIGALQNGTNFIYDVVSILMTDNLKASTNNMGSTVATTLTTDPTVNFDASLTAISTNNVVNSFSLTIGDQLVFGTDSSLSISGSDVLTAVAMQASAEKLQAVANLFAGIDWQLDLSTSTTASFVFGTGGDDTFKLGSGADWLMIDGGTDNSSTGGGADFIYAGNLLAYHAGGLSTIDGGAGKDTFALDFRELDNMEPAIEDFFSKGQTFDLTKVFQEGDIIVSLKSVENVRGTQYGDKLLGSAGANQLQGMEGDDTLTGRDGNDTLIGAAGADKLIGGAGADKLSGGAGDDDFIYTAVTDSSKQQDIISDFKHKQDDIDLSKLHPETKNDKFIFIGEGNFKHHAGELHFVLHDNSGTKNDFTMVEADLDGNGKADLKIELTHLIHLDAGDFIL